MRLTLLVLIVCILTIPFSYALTASIGNSRMVLRTEVEEGEITVIEKSILTKNVNNISVRVNLEADENYKKIVDIIDDEFILQPGESKRAEFRINLKSGGTYEGKILVSFNPEDPNNKQSPVGLSSTIIIIAEGPITEDYYDVMGKDTVEDEETEDLEESEDIFEEELLDEEEEETVSVSTGPVKPTSFEKESKITNKEFSAGPLIGILIVIVIVVLGLGGFFIIKKISK